MASNFYPLGVEKIIDGTIDVENDTIKVLLSNSSFSFDANDEFVSNVSTNEISGTGYTRKTLTNPVFEYSSDVQGVRFDADDVFFPTISVTDDLAQVVIFKEDTNDNTSPLIATLDFADVSTTGDDVKLTFSNTNGLFAMTTKPALLVEYIVIAGGGAGPSGGGGAGGYRSSVIGENSGGGCSAEPTIQFAKNVDIPITIGAGGTAPDIEQGICGGSNSTFSTITTIGGGSGGGCGTRLRGNIGGSGGGGMFTGCNACSAGTAGQGFRGGCGRSDVGGGGGGAGSAGEDGVNAACAGDGGVGVTSCITGSPIGRAGGGGGGTVNGRPCGVGNDGGGDGACILQCSATDGAQNTGGGGGGGLGAGGSGVVLLRYPSIYSITIGAGLCGTETTVGSNKVATITSGTGCVCFD